MEDSNHLPVPAAVCDGGDLDCGSGLLLIIRKAMDPLEPGQVLEVRSREVSVREDLPAWCRMVSHDFLAAVDETDYTRYLVRKGGSAAEVARGEPHVTGDSSEAGTLEDDLEKARHFQWAVRVRQGEQGESRVYARHQAFTVGQPLEFGFGSDSAPLSAVEYLLASLGACLASGYRIHASRKGVTVDQLELALQGSLDNPLVFLGVEDEGHPGFSRIRGTMYVNADADDDLLEDLWRTTLARSPIAATLRGSVTLDLKFTAVL